MMRYIFMHSSAAFAASFRFVDGVWRAHTCSHHTIPAGSCGNAPRIRDRIRHGNMITLPSHPVVTLTISLSRLTSLLMSGFGHPKRQRLNSLFVILQRLVSCGSSRHQKIVRLLLQPLFATIRHYLPLLISMSRHCQKLH